MVRKAWIEGDPLDLEILAQLLPSSGEVAVVHDGDRYYLMSPEIDNPTSGAKFSVVAERIITFINGYGRTIRADFRPVKLAGIYNDEAGITVVPASFTLVLRPSLSFAAVTHDASGNPVPAEHSSGPAHIALAISDPDVAHVLEMMSHVPVGWGDLFKIHERIQDSIQGSIPQMGWASRADDDAFSASANRSDVSGKDARHARREKRPPPKRTMTIDQGRKYIRDIIEKWLNWLAA